MGAVFWASPSPFSTEQRTRPIEFPNEKMTSGQMLTSGGACRRRPVAILIGLVAASLMTLSQPSLGQVSVSAGYGTGYGGGLALGEDAKIGLGTAGAVGGGLGLQISHFKGEVGYQSGYQSGGVFTWGLSYISIPPDSVRRPIFQPFYRIGVGVAAVPTRNQQPQSTPAAYALAGYKINFSKFLNLRLAVGLGRAEEKLRVMNSNWVPAVEVSLNYSVLHQL